MKERIMRGYYPFTHKRSLALRKLKKRKEAKLFFIRTEYFII